MIKHDEIFIGIYEKALPYELKWDLNYFYDLKRDNYSLSDNRISSRCRIAVIWYCNKMSRKRSFIEI